MSRAGALATSIHELPITRILGNSKGLESVIVSSRKKKETAMREPGVAAVLSAIIPGVGQFYNGRFLAGILWLIITPGLWIGTGGLLGWVCHVISAYTAYSYARDHSGQPWKRWVA
jgi:TM2 domain-containing membrane protein YozV